MLTLIEATTISNISCKAFLRCDVYAVVQCFSTFLSPWTIFFKKYLMEHFVILAPHEQLAKTVLHKGQ